MHLYEYQAKRLLCRQGIPVLPGDLLSSPGEVPAALKQIADAFYGWHGPWVVKAQIRAGSRSRARLLKGFGSGIYFASNREELEAAAGRMIGNILLSPQTGPYGEKITTLLVEPAVEVVNEIYVALVLSSKHKKILLLLSDQGGCEIEKLIGPEPQGLIQYPVDVHQGLQPYQARQLARRIGLSGKLLLQAAEILSRLYQTWLTYESLLIELNPLALVRYPWDGLLRFVALDAKIVVDDNALYRHPELSEFGYQGEDQALEIEAQRLGFSYVKLAGNIGCIVNGAGLAMATMDLIEHYGGRPANFLDLGGGASRERVAKAVRILFKDPDVKVLLVNIFGGITDCQCIAEGIIDAAGSTACQIPIIVRFEGTGAERGREILASSLCHVQLAGDLDQAALLAVRAALTK